MSAVAAVAVFLGAALQSATGFGFALIAAPILFAILGPSQAVTAGVLLGLELSLLTLATEARRPRVLPGDAVALVAWSLPGLAVGAIALRELPDRLLSVLVALAVLAALILRLRHSGRDRAAVRRARQTAGPGAASGAVRRRRWQTAASGAVRRRWQTAAAGAASGAGPRARQTADAGAASGAVRRRWQTAAAGAASGALSTSTSLSGPPLVLYLLARGASPQQTRDTLAAIFVALSLLSAPALVLTGTFDVPHGVWVLLAAGAAGQVLGRRGFARLGDRYETAVLIVLALTAVVALGSSAV